MATYDGLNIFGRSVTVRVEESPSAAQINEFFGVSGVQSLYGGQRGRTFLITGVLAAPTPYDLASARALFLGYDDGLGRVLVDNLGVAWPLVVFRRFQPGERILCDGYGYYLPYKAQFDGLA